MDIKQMIDRAIKEHETRLHPRKRRFKPPTLEDVKKYIQENPELSNIDPYDFWKGYSDGGWIDTYGKPVRNWKLKLRTRSNCSNAEKSTQELQCRIRTHGVQCSNYGSPSGQDDSGQQYYICEKHKGTEH
jgi:hypothetical protein